MSKYKNNKNSGNKRKITIFKKNLSFDSRLNVSYNSQYKVRNIPLLDID